ncbi:hypothetical protein [Deinococcus sp.]|uniref:hypothetical protein n=1 Tax=Deinococcus sp. TaxID=47478 RepID=UPI003CC57A31
MTDLRSAVIYDANLNDLSIKGHGRGMAYYLSDGGRVEARGEFALRRFGLRTSSITEFRTGDYYFGAVQDTVHQDAKTYVFVEITVHHIYDPSENRIWFALGDRPRFFDSFEELEQMTRQTPAGKQLLLEDMSG